MLTLLALISLGIWLFLIFGWAGFWRADQRLPEKAGNGHLDSAPPIIAIVPARDEAETIGACITSLLNQTYDGALTVILVDDGSADGTAEMARSAARQSRHPDALHIVTASPLHPGWSGKLWALDQGLTHAQKTLPAPAFFWLSDADIVHAPDTLSRLCAQAARHDLDLVSLMVRLHCERFWERLLVPAFIFFFQLLYPFRAVNDPASPVAAAAGGCILISANALARIGGIAAVHDRLIDDVALASAVKQAGFKIWLGLGDTSHSLRKAAGLADLWHMVSRTAYTQLRYSPFLLIGTLAGLGLTYIAPPMLLLSAPWHGSWPAALLGAAGWAAMTATYRPTLRYYGRPWWQGLALPGVAALYAAMTVHSAINHGRGKISRWKGREYTRP